MRKLLLLILLSFYAACGSQINDQNSVQLELENAVGNKFDGIIVYVDQDEDSEYYSAGWKNRENKIPADPYSLFKIASISKLYIAAATSKIIYEGSLSLDKRLAEYLPDLDGRIENAEIITLRMMLQHRSGIPNFTDEEYGYPWGETPMSTWKTLELVLDMPADFKPNKNMSIQIQITCLLVKYLTEHWVIVITSILKKKS